MKKQFKIFFSIIFLTLFFVCSATIVGASEDSILTAHWDFNEGSGDIIYDSIGGYNGTRSGSTQWGDGYIDFDSGHIETQNGHVNTGWIPSTKVFTLIMTVKIGATGGDSSFLFVNNGFQLRVAGGTQNAKLWGFGVDDQIGIDMSGMTTIAIVHDGSNIKTFKNGQYIQTFNNAFSEDSSWDWFFGSSGSYLTSRYDDVKLYNIALTNDDVASEYNNGAVNCTQDTWDCSSWEQCSINGTRIRSCEKTYDCSAIDTPLPVTTQSCTPECTEDIWECGGWSDCSVDGNKTRNCSKTLECSLVDTPSPNVSQSCTYTPPTCTSWTYSGWSACTVNGQQTRTVVYSSPNGCLGGNPIITQSCTYIPPTCTSWTYSNWSSCSINGTQTRNITSLSPSDCSGGNPVLSQSCSYIPVCTSDDWLCDDWSSCSGDKVQSRVCSKISNCEGGVLSPTTAQSCDYTSECTADIWECGSWDSCSSDGLQNRQCVMTNDCSAVETSSPNISQSCSYAPSCTEDTWSCEEWSECSPLGIKTRNCLKTYDCSIAETVPDNYQSCVYDDGSNDNTQELHEAIVKSTVQLLCFNDSNGIVGSGSGTVIDKSGIILTNKHVIKDRNKKDLDGCFVGFTNDINSYPDFSEVAFIIDQSYGEDIALLKIYNGNNNYFFTDIDSGSSQNLSFGKSVLAYGYPVYNQNPKTVQDLIQKITFSSGDYSGDEGWGYFKTTAMLEHGISGGGAYTKNGVFTGITSAGLVGETNTMGLILRIENVINWINSSASNNFAKELDNFSSISNFSSMSVENFNDSNSSEESDKNDKQINNKNQNESVSEKVIREEKNLITKIDNKLSKRVSGNILLQVEKNGEGWYVNPDNKKKYYLGRPADAFSIMRNLGLGIKHSELKNYINSKFPSRLSGKILLDVEQNGEAYYVNPDDLKGYYLNRPADAFRVMRELGLGITNNDIRKIDVGEI